MLHLQISIRFCEKGRREQEKNKKRNTKQISIYVCVKQKTKKKRVSRLHVRQLISDIICSKIKFVLIIEMFVFTLHITFRIYN